MEFVDVVANVDFPFGNYTFSGLIRADEYEKCKDDDYYSMTMYIASTDAPYAVLKKLYDDPPNEWFAEKIEVMAYEIEEVRGRVIVPIGTPPPFPEVLQTGIGELWYTATKGGFNYVAQ